MKPFRPMKAADVGDLEALRYPLIAQPKIDGIRALNVGGVLVSATLKPIPNQWAQRAFCSAPFHHYDGELVLPGAKTFAETASAVMAKDGPPLHWELFDQFEDADIPYYARYRKIPPLLGAAMRVYSSRVHNAAMLLKLHRTFVQQGYEGTMLRAPYGPYKFGRSTLREGYLLKLKDFVDAEATIVGVEWLQHNANEATRDARGLTKRSTAKAGKTIEIGTVGAVLVSRGAGDFSLAVPANLRAEFSELHRRKRLLGQVVTYKHQPHGASEKPRIPVLKGLRHSVDR